MIKATTNSVFTLLVDNEFGVLTRITAMIRRAGWNIRSLAVAETKIPEISRLTICLECRHHTLSYVLGRLGTLKCVREITVFSDETQVAREFAILQLKSPKSAIEVLCKRFSISVLENDGDKYFISVTAEPGELDELIAELGGNLVDIARTGAVALRRAANQEVQP